MKTKFLTLSTLLLSTSLYSQVLVYDDFNSASVNPNLWNVVLPFSQSQILESGGYLTTTGRGTLESVAGFNSPYTISGAVTLSSVIEHFEVTMRSNLQTGYQSTDGRVYYELTGVKVEMSADGDQISIQQFTPTDTSILIQENYSIVVGQQYNYAITDTGSEIDFSIDGVNMLSSQTTYATGNQIAFQSNIFSTASSSLDYVQIAQMPEPSILAIIGIWLLSIVGLKRAN